MGPKGSGKSKTLISLVSEAVTNEEGSVVCIVKDDRYNYSVEHSVRLINSQEFVLNGASELYGFICGIISMNFDVSHIFIDSVTKIMNSSIADIDEIIPYLESLSEKMKINFTIVVSGDQAEANELTKKYTI
jgi:serine kinase of HPr protein (carbohydrate metabolism regulator)